MRVTALVLVAFTNRSMVTRVAVNSNAFVRLRASRACNERKEYRRLSQARERHVAKSSFLCI